MKITFAASFMALTLMSCSNSVPVCAGTVGCTVPTDGTAVKVYCQDSTYTMKTTSASNYVTVSCVKPTPSPTPSVTPSPSPSVKPSASPTPSPTPSPTVSPTPSPTPSPTVTGTPVALTAVWANDGEDKVTQDDLRASKGSVVNTEWNGSKVTVFGAKNEVVGFNLVLEAKTQAASNVSVTFNTLTGPGGATIKSTAATGDGVFNWAGRNIELFYVKYLTIKGLSRLGYENYYDERHIPARMRRPFTGAGAPVANTKWTDRPDHDKAYPDIAVPLELQPTFNVAAGQSQSIWVDVYVPKTAATGLYTGTVTVAEAGKTSYSVPVELTVKSFTLPDVPSAKTMLNFSGQGGDIAWRYTGTQWPNAGDANDVKTAQVRKLHMMLAHRHKISLMGDDMTSTDAPTAFWQPALNGSMFTAANGYDGPGVGVGNNVYSIGTYGTWQAPWGTTAATGLQTHMNAWETWFRANSPSTERFVYLVDESSNFTQTEQWAGWAKSNTGVGGSLPTLATVNLMDAVSKIPDLTYPTTAAGFQPGPAYANAATSLRTDPLKKNYQYNGSRPATGCYMTEDDGVALRVNAWGQYKKGVDRWFYWESTYYNDYQNGRGQTDVFNNAQTFGAKPGAADAIIGETGYLHSNGDGVLFYPGTDKVFPASSYNAGGPFASLRLKHWRRGVQDVDYLTAANAINPTATQAIVNQMVPKVLWDVGVDTLSDPTYVHADVSWSTNPNDWETARAKLSDIIEGKTSLKKSVKKTTKHSVKKH